MAPRRFCQQPFSWFEVTGWCRPKGDTYLCCPGWLPTTIGNLSRQSVDEIWNGEAAQRIRRSILDGSFAYCDKNKCPFLQAGNGPVQDADDVTDSFMRRVIDEGLTELPWGPREINCGYDSSCNLSCPSCRVSRVIETDQADAIEQIQAKIEREALPDASCLKITGSGDPFGSPYFNRWLRTMSIPTDSKLSRIHLHTNAQLWTPRMWSKIPLDVRERIRTTEISIDAAQAETYAVNRRGGSFDRLIENLEFIAGLRRREELHFLTVSMVVQANNFREMPAFVELGQRFDADLVLFGQLTNWGTFADDEFRRRAVHFVDHREHDEFLTVLGDQALSEPCVTLGNLSNLLPSST